MRWEELFQNIIFVKIGSKINNIEYRRRWGATGKVQLTPPYFFAILLLTLNILMENPIKIIQMTNCERLISQIEEVGAEIGEPDCKLINPMEICEGNMLSPWMVEVTMQDTFMISSDKIITLADPTPTLLEKYLQETK